MKRIPSLNGLRGLSVIIVILYHMSLMNFDDTIKIPILFDGVLGVNVFFVLSGFLITTLLMNEEEKTGTISIIDFYFRRTLRILPIYYALITVYLILELTGVLNFTIGSWYSSLFYSKQFNYQNDWESSHLWSLSIEEYFYLIWPFIFKYLPKSRIRIAWMVVLIVPAIRLLLHYYSVKYMTNFSIFQRSDSIMWGCLLGIYREKIYIKNSRNVDIGILMAFVFIYVMNEVNPYNPINVTLGKSAGTMSSLWICMLLLRSIQYGFGWWYKFLNCKLMNYLGKISYSLYMWQQIFFSTNLGFLAKPPLNLLLIFLTAILSYNFIEKPFLKIKNKSYSPKILTITKVGELEEASLN